MQVDLMRVLSVPQLSSGTFDLVRGHPLLTNRQLTYLRYAGSQKLRLDDVELQGEDAHPSSSSTNCNHSKLLLTSWFAQVELSTVSMVASQLNKDIQLPLSCFGRPA